MTDLIPLENVNAVELFSDEKSIQALLDEIEKQATDFDSDVTTDEGRAEIRSMAYKVAQSKIVIDKAGKDLTAEWTAKKKIVDTGRKKARDFCDNLRNQIRKPLTDYETEEARKVAELAKAAADKAEYEAALVEAYAEDELWEREKKVRDLEERLEAEETERKRITETQKAEDARKKEIIRIRLEAEETARREAQAAIDKAEEQAARAEEERIQAEEAREAEAEQAERKRLDDIEAERKRGIAEAERIERERLALIEKNNREAQARAADRENRRKINTTIVDVFVTSGIGARTARRIVTLVAGGKIPNISIRY